jgi:hypothetical protein
MALSRNPTVHAAYVRGTYLDDEGHHWRRGMDGWFLDNVDGKGGVMLVRHDDMVAMIEKEHPDND